MYVTVYKDPVANYSGYETMGGDIVIISSANTNPITLVLNTSVSPVIDGLNLIITSNIGD